jgi:uncharacterized protein
MDIHSSHIVENTVSETGNLPAQKPSDLARPVAAAERIKTIDMVRGIALCGILLMNIPGFGFDWSNYFPIMRGSHSNPDFITLATVSVFFEGTMRGLFSMLFGAGMILFTLNKKETPGGVTVAEFYYRRLLLLVAFGVVNAFILLWRGDILFYYGLCGLLLFPFRKVAAKWLFVLGFLLFAIGAFKNNLNYSQMRETRAGYLEAVKAEKQGKALTDEQKKDKEQWLQRENWKPDPQDAQRNMSKMRGDYATVFNHYLEQNANNEMLGMYHWAIFDCTGMMLIGMALFSLGFFSNKWTTSGYLMSLLIGYGIGIPIGYFMFFKGDLGWLNIASYVDSYSVPHQTLYDLKRVFLSLGHASLAMLVFRSRIVPWLMKSLAAVGQMAFTNYLMQSVICTLFFYGYGLGYFGKLRYHELYYVVGAVWLFQLITSPIWLRYFKFGPLEWVWRSATYWKKQPMKG